MSKLNNIIAGWWNLTFPSVETEMMAIKRAKICSTCTSNVNNTCTQCGCWLSAAVRAPKKQCPLNKWKDNNK